MQKRNVLIEWKFEISNAKKSMYVCVCTYNDSKLRLQLKRSVGILADSSVNEFPYKTKYCRKSKPQKVSSSSELMRL